MSKCDLVPRDELAKRYALLTQDLNALQLRRWRRPVHMISSRTSAGVNELRDALRDVLPVPERKKAAVVAVGEAAAADDAQAESSAAAAPPPRRGAEGAPARAPALTAQAPGSGRPTVHAAFESWARRKRLQKRSAQKPRKMR